MARLPVELYEIVLEHCSRSDLITLARVSRTTQPEAERILYRDVKFPADTRGAVTSAVMFCKRICQSSRRAAYVITLLSEIGLSSAYSLPTLRRLFSRTVARIPNLRILRVVKSELLDFVILTQSHLKLWSFESDSDDGTTLFEFLITQSELRSLSLRLFLPNAIHFPLSPHLLPNLTVLLASACDAPHIMLGRPVSHVYIWDKPKVFLANLKGSATGVKVLRVFVVSPTTMKTIAHVVPNVEVLLVQPYIRVSYDMEDFIIALSNLKKLRTLGLRFRSDSHWSSAATIGHSIVKTCQSVHTLILRRDVAGASSSWWIWKSGMSEMKLVKGTRDNNQSWSEEIAKLQM